MAMPSTDAELLGPMIDIRSPAAITNPDANNLIYWCDSYLVEFSRAASATRRDTTKADLRRLSECVAALRKRTDHFYKVPELDRPKYHPEDIPVPVPPKLNRVENADVQHILDSLVAVRIQLSFMDSAERASGISSYDHERCTAEYDKLDMFIEEIITAKPTHDLPDADFQEPTPQTPIRSNF
jgi:hypothetical protein